MAQRREQKCLSCFHCKKTAGWRYLRCDMHVWENDDLSEKMIKLTPWERKKKQVSIYRKSLNGCELYDGDWS